MGRILAFCDLVSPGATFRNVFGQSFESQLFCIVHVFQRGLFCECFEKRFGSVDPQVVFNRILSADVNQTSICLVSEAIEELTWFYPCVIV